VIPGFLLIDKPEGPSSHDMVNLARRVFQIRRIGHTGTLDPFASGLLILCLGSATRLSEYLLHRDKSYTFELILGQTSTTCDRTGEITMHSSLDRVKEISRASLQEVLEAFAGPQEQIPPMYSAIKIKGKKMYEYAREGRDVKPDPRRVVIHSLNLLDFRPPDVVLEARVGAGTYIRSLGRDIGKKLGVGAYVTSLRRTSIGDLSVERAVSPENLAIDENGRFPGWMSVLEIFSDWPRIQLVGAELERVYHGNPVPREEPAAKGNAPFLIEDESGRVAAVGGCERNARSGWMIKPLKVFPPPG